MKRIISVVALLAMALPIGAAVRPAAAREVAPLPSAQSAPAPAYTAPQTSSAVAYRPSVTALLTVNARHEHKPVPKPQAKKKRAQLMCPEWTPLLVKYGIDPAWGDRIIHRESHCDQAAHNDGVKHGVRVSKDDSWGLFQMSLYGTLRAGRLIMCGVSDPSEVVDPELNIACAAKLYNHGRGKKHWGG